jgi:hypothetical protein
MPNDFTIPTIAAIPFGNARGAKPIAATVKPATLVDTPPTPHLTINPVLRLDEGLGVVVIEFVNDRGEIATSIPSQRQLEAYRRWDRSRLGPTPSGRTNNVTSTPSADLHTPTVTGQQDTNPGKTPKAESSLLQPNRQAGSAA